MTSRPAIDGVLVQWGERLFYPSNRIVKSPPLPRLDESLRRQAAAVRQRIEATVKRRAPQVMVKVTGGGRGMAAITAHFRYISKNGRLPFEDDRSVVRDGKEALHDLIEQWRYGGSLIDEVSQRREAFNIMLSMPQGTDGQIVLKAAREFAQVELHDHRYVMVLHEHQANPHVHLSVRTESIAGMRLNPRKTDLHRWRETFAEKLRGWGVDAEATRQATRGATRNYESLWRVKAKEVGRLRSGKSNVKSGERYRHNREGALEAWSHILRALESSEAAGDRGMAQRVQEFLNGTDYMKASVRQHQYPSVSIDRSARERPPPRVTTKMRPGREIER